MKKILVLIPTFNEAGNIEELIEGIFKLNVLGIEVLIVDDNSTDGTVRIIENLKKKYKKINILVREKKMGIGSAHLVGIMWAYERKFDFLVTMDADLTHSPSYIPRLINCLSGYDLAIASRYLKGSKMIGWSFLRRFLTFLNHSLVSFFFSIKFDTSNAFRAYNLQNIPRSLFKKISSSSYGFFFESLIYFKENRIRICEIPVVMKEREAGKSKLKLRDVIYHVRVFLELLFKYYFRRADLRI